MLCPHKHFFQNIETKLTGFHKNNIQAVITKLIQIRTAYVSASEVLRLFYVPMKMQVVLDL